jgi:hypothetical protein
MNLTPAQQCELSSILAQHGLDVVLRDMATLIADHLHGVPEDLETAILTNVADVHKAADSITYRAWTGRDLFSHEVQVGTK